eukprot:gene28146-31249_t
MASVVADQLGQTGYGSVVTDQLGQLGRAGVTGVTSGPLTNRSPLGQLSSNTNTGWQEAGSSVWEGRKAAALLAMEDEKLALLRRIEEYEGIKAEHARELRNHSAAHKEQLTEQRESFERRLRDSAGIAGRRLQSLYTSAWGLFERRRREVYRMRAFWYWYQAARKSRRLRWAEAVWGKRILSQFFMEWSVAAAASRRQREAEEASAGRESNQQEQLALRNDRFLLRWRTSHLAAVLTAWQEQTGVQRFKRWQASKAERIQNRHLLAAGWHAFVSNASTDDAERTGEHVVRRLNRMRLRVAFRAVEAEYLAQLGTAAMALTETMSLRGFQGEAEYMAQLGPAAMALTETTRCLLFVDMPFLVILVYTVLTYQLIEAEYLAQLGKAAKALDQTRRHIYLQHCFKHIWRRAHSTHRFHAIQRSNHHAMLLAWLGHACKWSRHQRVIGGLERQQTHKLLWLSLMAWRLVGKLRGQADLSSNLEARIAELQQSLVFENVQLQQSLVFKNVQLQQSLVFENVQLQSVARIAKLQQSLVFENNQLQSVARIAELQQSLVFENIQLQSVVEHGQALEAEVEVLAVEAKRGFLSKELVWRPLPPAPLPLPESRCRHAAFMLPAIQTGSWGQEAQGKQGPGGASWQLAPDGAGHMIPTLSSTVVVFGGVSGEAWFKDVCLLSVMQSDNENIQVAGWYLS